MLISISTFIKIRIVKGWYFQLELVCYGETTKSVPFYIKYRFSLVVFEFYK